MSLKRSFVDGAHSRKISRVTPIGISSQANKLNHGPGYGPFFQQNFAPPRF